MNGNETLITTQPQSQMEISPPPPSRWRRPLIVLAIIVSTALLVLAIFLALRRLRPAVQVAGPENNLAASEETASSTVLSLPTLGEPLAAEATATSSLLSDAALDALSFSDYYAPFDNDLQADFQDYRLPLNVKIDVVNYYDVSRKLSLDPYIDTLNSQGFSLIDNPWAQPAPTFSSIYSNLDAKQLPLLVTADFLLFYHQNTMKRVFKDIEKNVFFETLWDMSLEMYQLAKARYEAHLAQIGNINDPVLEAERLETAFFAVALELLKPRPEQVAKSSELRDSSLFALAEKDRFYFVVPPYLRDDVLAEVSLIRAGQAVKAKSPVMLYNRDYREFAVPKEYKQNAKLTNFHLAAGWLNSAFPLNYRTPACPDCWLDQADWRINLTAASLIAQDFSTKPTLKNRWARIYKVMSYFQGLRSDLNYLNYRDSLVALFGADYRSEELFATKNEAAIANLEKLRAKLLAYEWSPLAGALDPEREQARQGLKVLSESYWPNDYIFRRLTAPATGNYLGESIAASNQTICRAKNNKNRCGGTVFDAINLAYPADSNAYFLENANYERYDSQASALRAELDELSAWQASSYWHTLFLSRAMFSAPKEQQPAFMSARAWGDRNLKTAAAAWVNLQLPPLAYTLSVTEKPDKKLAFSRNPDNAYVEPNLPLINELIANNEMIQEALGALSLSSEIRPALGDLATLHRRLKDVRAIVIKELSGQPLDEEDNNKIVGFIRELQVEDPSAQSLETKINMPSGDALRLDLSRFKLLVLVRPEGENRIFAVGPVWDYRESR